MGEFVVAGSDPAEVFDALKKVFHQMAFAIAAPTVAAGGKAIGARRNAGSHPALQEPVPERIAVITLVGDQQGAWDFLRQGLRMGNVGVVARTQQQADRLPRLVHHRVDLRVHAALGASHRLRRLPASGIAGAAMHPHMGRIEKTPRTLQGQFDLRKELCKDALPRPAAETMDKSAGDKRTGSESDFTGLLNRADRITIE